MVDYFIKIISGLRYILFLIYFTPKFTIFVSPPLGLLKKQDLNTKT